MKTSQEVGQEIKKIRLSLKLTQAEFGKQINVSEKTVSSWETGVSYPSMVNLDTISKRYSIRIDTLLAKTKKISIQSFFARFFEVVMSFIFLFPCIGFYGSVGGEKPLFNQLFSNLTTSNSFLVLFCIILSFLFLLINLSTIIFGSIKHTLIFIEPDIELVFILVFCLINLVLSFTFKNSTAINFLVFFNILSILFEFLFTYFSEGKRKIFAIIIACISSSILIVSMFNSIQFFLLRMTKFSLTAAIVLLGFLFFCSGVGVYSLVKFSLSFKFNRKIQLSVSLLFAALYLVTFILMFYFKILNDLLLIIILTILGSFLPLFKISK